MKISIHHKTTYTFDAPVFLEPHYLRFKPRNMPHLSVSDFTLQISQKPVGMSEQVDPEGNLVHFCWFEGMHQQLSIALKMELKTESFNPFNFLVYPLAYATCPFVYEPYVKKQLRSALEAASIAEPLLQFGKLVLAESNHQTIPFLTNLTQKIHQSCEVIVREKGRAYEPDKTFQLQKGSCRDLAWMQVQLLRNLGFAARFVSGYFYLDVEKPTFELHAWLEVYIPGGGWIGFDPSHGSITSQMHVPVASSIHFDNTMAVSGTLRGDAFSTMETDLHIEVLG